MAFFGWKNLISFDDHLDEGKSILSNRRASNWELHDGAEDGYLGEEKDQDPEENLPLANAITNRTTPEGHDQSRGSTTKKLLLELIYIEGLQTGKTGNPILTQYRRTSLTLQTTL